MAALNLSLVYVEQGDTTQAKQMWQIAIDSGHSNEAAAAERCDMAAKQIS